MSKSVYLNRLASVKRIYDGNPIDTVPVNVFNSLLAKSINVLCFRLTVCAYLKIQIKSFQAHRCMPFN